MTSPSPRTRLEKRPIAVEGAVAVVEVDEVVVVAEVAVADAGSRGALHKSSCAILFFILLMSMLGESVRGTGDFFDQAHFSHNIHFQKESIRDV